ncbi:MAG: hypothetical protein A3B81_07245 [Candidatus Muproteobacteria bacterium RIFCSPHIGHO2_02_FULL_65_16]|uniref:Type III pantothenate kinase n=1 Tax=Candidatus Muproteobacteria bacterium RIFCSPHIGHO2_02_FULL_65_16 TaxID=1817766 RepID=A0A1F6TUU8_9PROT|nr:MAG: hypothetical protein A3B81_07245 [Candidatus Muproteobacteria bacterium RIFCSPHIGHO2_02_FULL_65_16]
MSMLLLDIGNSRLRWVLHGSGWWEPRSALHRSGKIENLLDEVWEGMPTPEKIVVVSVAGREVMGGLKKWLKRRWSLAPYLVTPQAELLGVKNGYADPYALGADRWAALIAARGLSQGPACVVDCGTAVTVDALSAEGVFKGGVIFPGLLLLRQSLVRGTAGIDATPGNDATCLARSTADGVAAGTIVGLAGAIERFVEEQQNSLWSELKIFLTGGDAQLLEPRLRRPVMVVPDLVLKGLVRIADTL